MMAAKHFILISALMVYVMSYGQTAGVDTTTHKKPVVAAAPTVKQDTAVVSKFDGIPVFYHCQPLHSYKTVGIMGRTSLVSYSSQAFERYARAARRRNKGGRIGIVIDNLNFGTDSFQIVQFPVADAHIDTAVFTTPIFLSAKPTKHYKVVRVLNDELAYGSLNNNLQRYMKKAGDLHIPYDGIMLRDVNYTFKKDQIFVFRWKK
jgi:hypothetical protein